MIHEKPYSQHPKNPDNYWLSEDDETVICSHCAREYPAKGEDKFDPSKENCSEDCPQYDNQKG